MSQYADVTDSLIGSLILVALVLILWAVYRFLRMVAVAVWRLLGALYGHQTVGPVGSHAYHRTLQMRPQGLASSWSRGEGQKIRSCCTSHGRGEESRGEEVPVGFRSVNEKCQVGGSLLRGQSEQIQSSYSSNVHGGESRGEAVPVGFRRINEQCQVGGSLLRGHSKQIQSSCSNNVHGGESRGEKVPVRFRSVNEKCQVGGSLFRGQSKQIQSSCSSNAHGGENRGEEVPVKFTSVNEQCQVGGSWLRGQNEQIQSSCSSHGCGGESRGEELPVTFIQNVIDKFNGQRQVGDQFAVVVLSSERVLKDIGRLKFWPCDYLYNPLVNSQYIFYPPPHQYVNYIVARPERQFWCRSVHAEEIILSEICSLLWAYRRAEGRNPTYILFYSWMMPCSNCTSAIITLSYNLNSKIVVVYTIDWKGISEEENDENRDWLYAAGIIVERVGYSPPLPPAQSTLPVYWPFTGMQ